ncbi:MAG: DNA polymerase III subunit gamma/tau [Thermodesulfovibrionales bacterium]
MSYLVLARKWRPQGFEDLIGQQPIVQILTNSITQGKMAHAYVFSGPRGVGKTSTARIMAKALNCEKGPTPAPCGSCPSCVSITEGNSVDVIEIDGASNNSVDDIRDLRDRVKYAPSGGRYKVYIIDESHMLSVQAFNALLKTLEEPPPHVFFVLATTEPRKIPLTVMSRCQHLPFRRVSIQGIRDRLKRIVEAEGIRITDGALALIARAADGSIRDSLTILDQVASFSAEVTEENVKDLLGVADFKALSETAGAVLKGERQRVLSIVASLVDKGTDLRAFTKDLIKFFRDLLVARVVSSPDEVLDMAADETDALREASQGVSEEQLAVALSELIRAEQDVRGAFSPRVALEMALLKISYLSMLRPVNEALAALSGPALPTQPGAPAPARPASQVRAGDDKPPAPVGQSRADKDMPRKPAPKAKPREEHAPVAKAGQGGREEEPPVPQDGDSLLRSIIERVEDIKISSRLSNAKATLDGEVLTLTFNSSDAEICAEPVKANSVLIAEIAAGIRNAPTRVKININQCRIASRKELREKVLQEPIVQEALELFEGRVVDVRQVDGEGNTPNGR